MRHSVARAVTWLTLMVAAAGLVLSARAQEGVTGGAPVFSGPKKQVASPPDDPSTDPKIHVQSNLVTAPVTVLDSSGQFVYDLEESDFQILDNGVPQQIASFENEASAVAAVIVIQTSESIEPLVDEVRPLAPVFSDLLLGPHGQAAVIFFDDRIRLAHDFSNDGEELGTVLRSVKAGGDKARLNDALLRAVALLEKRPKIEKRVIVTFSDGFDKGSETKQDEVVRRATGAEVSIYGLGFNPFKALLDKKPQAPPQNPLDANVTRPLPPGVVPTPTRSENVYGAPVDGVPIMTATEEIIRASLASSLLEYYAGYTGGVFYSHWSKNALQERLTRIATEINSQYELAYVPDTLGQTGFHRIQVQVRRQGVKVRTRAGYFYPAVKP